VAVAQLDDFRFHDLRHTFASNFVMRGGSLQSLKEILGHGSMAMTLRYAHLAPEHVRGEMERTARTHEAHAAKESIPMTRVRPSAYTDEQVSP
jgi:site-specific recombinase XerD